MAVTAPFECFVILYEWSYMYNIQSILYGVVPLFLLICIFIICCMKNNVLVYYIYIRYTRIIVSRRMYVYAIIFSCVNMISSYIRNEVYLYEIFNLNTIQQHIEYSYTYLNNKLAI